MPDADDKPRPNPYEPPGKDIGKSIAATSHSEFSFARMVVLVAVAVVIAFILVKLWMWSAQFSWSSEKWLLSIPLVIVVCGFGAVTAIAVYLLTRRKKPLPHQTNVGHDTITP